MSDEPSVESEEERIDREAAEWLARESGGMEDAERSIFEAWLRQDARHRRAVAAYREMRAGFGQLQRHAGESGTVPNPDWLALPEPRQRKQKWRLPASLAALAACLAVALLLFGIVRDPANPGAPSSMYAADLKAQQFERRFLPDGTLLELRQGAEVEVRYDETRRGLRLIAGEVYFSVAKDPLRPLVVKAGQASIRVVGTAFNVRLSNSQVELLVTEGVVAVEKATPEESPAESRGPPLIEQALQANQKITIRFASSVVTSAIEGLEVGEIAERLSWKHETLHFENTPLREVAREFNRRNRDQIVIADKALRQERIDGVFRSDDLAAFVELMEVSASLHADRSEPGRIILSQITR